MVKGVVYILEATVAAVIIMSSIFYLYTPVQGSPESGMSDIGYSCLRQADNSGKLAMYAQNNDEAGLKAELASCIPNVVEYEVRICSTSDCTASVPIDKSVVSVPYFSSGYKTAGSSLVNLWMWSQ